MLFYFYIYSSLCILSVIVGLHHVSTMFILVYLVATLLSHVFAIYLQAGPRICLGQNMAILGNFVVDAYCLL